MELLSLEKEEKLARYDKAVRYIKAIMLGDVTYPPYIEELYEILITK